MKKAASLFFLLVFTLATTEAGQLLKLPGLLDHYITHAQRDNFSFSDFMKVHYTQGHPNDGDEQEESRMPFKTLGPGFSLTVFSPANTVEAPVVRSRPVLHIPIPSSYKLSDPLFSIFHPPRLAC